jgi:LAO/AO transport system kinase
MNRSRTVDLESLVEGVLRREQRALARAISIVEDDVDGGRELIHRLYGETGGAKVVGITGPPGAGKSTLVDRLARTARAAEETVGVLAVDPTSPFSGGAILGDRVRMQALYTDRDVFIRSMATRGAMGGLTRATHDAIDILDAAGFDWILVETVGVGQDEVDVVRTVDTVVVVTVPGLGDDIQAIKAGILEIADVFVINKSDRDGAQRTWRDLKMMLSLSEANGWTPPILQAVASQGEGVEELMAAIRRHFDWLVGTGELEQRRRAHLRQRVEEILQRRVLVDAERVAGLGRAVEGAYDARRDPYEVADNLYGELVGAGHTAMESETAP